MNDSSGLVSTTALEKLSINLTTTISKHIRVEFFIETKRELSQSERSLMTMRSSSLRANIRRVKLKTGR